MSIFANKCSVMTYRELLLRPEWKEKCNEILKRDCCRCSNCGRLGFHNNSKITFKSKAELDCFLSPITFDNKTVTEFINEYLTNPQIIYSHLNAKAHIIGQNPELGTSGIRVMEVERVEGPYQPITEADKIDYTVRKFFIYPEGAVFDEGEHVLGYRIRDINISYDDNIIISYDKGGIFIFNHNLTEDYIVTIQKVYSDPFRRVFYYLNDNIILSITHRNVCFTIYFASIISTNTERTYLSKAKDYGLNIHHNFYVHNCKPWEYDDTALITLCEICHKDFHEKNKVPVYKNVNGALEYTGDAEICDKCGGSGYLPQFKYYENGVCFKCMGEGVILPE